VKNAGVNTQGDIVAARRVVGKRTETVCCVAAAGRVVKEGERSVGCVIRSGGIAEKA
jgi:hypothetical protein